ncbi:unnamed protein product, partial [Prorocentrum cordatum]
ACSPPSPSTSVMAGGFHAIRYRVGGVALWHERLVLGVSAGFAYVVTPDFDDYDEPIVVGPDVRAVLPLAGQGDTPAALVGAAVHRFRRLPTAAELWAAVGRSVAAGYPMPADPLLLALAAGNAAGAPPGPFPLADPAAAAAAAPAPPLALPPADGPAAPVPPGAAPGVAALAAALGPVPPGPAAAPPLAPVPGAAAGGALAVDALPVPAGDFRVLPMAINQRGERERRFGETVNGLSETEVVGWPIQGPRTLLWCLSFMSTMAGTPTAWHQRWLTAMALADDDEYAKLHETLCRVLDLAVVYDQLQVAEMASFEVVARQLQLLEERVYESRSAPPTAAAPKAKSGARSAATATAVSMAETSYFLGAGVSKANLCISPKLLEYIADQMKAEAAISKERRKAALVELLASAPGYSGESRVRPYDKELVSWPKHVAGMLEWEVAERQAPYSTALTTAMRDSGIDDDAMLVDGSAPRPLRDHGDIIAAGYVDNFATVSLSPDVATASCQAIRDVLVARGLPVEEFAPAAQRVTFTGLDILGDVGVVRCKVDRLSRLRQALLGLLRRGFASPLAFSAVVGHCTWGMITNRPMLSIFHAVYRFMGQDSRRALPLWPSVVSELRAAASLIPLWWADVRAEWAATTFCSDASPYGIGVCRKFVEQEVVAAAGRRSEKWRYHFSDAVHARAHALGVDPNVVLEAAVSKRGLKDCEQCPRDVLVPEGFAIHYDASVLCPQLAAFATLCDGSLARAMPQTRRRGQVSLSGRPSRSTKRLHPEFRRQRATTVTKQRTKTHPGPQRLGRGALSVLESAAVSDTTMANYWGAAKKFEVWCRWTSQTFTTAAEVDVILVTYFVNLFLDGFDSATGRVLLASLKHYLPSILVGRTPCPRAARALTGWRKLVPPQMRLPLPRAAMASIVGVLISWKLFGMAVFVRLMFDTYLRPSEAYRLTAGSVIRPRPDAARGYGHWALIVNDACLDRPGKTGEMDESVIVDNPTLWPLLDALVLGKKTSDGLWTFAPDEVRSMFRRAAAALGLEAEMTLYSLRHGGASDDLLSLRRTRKEVKDRGRWRTDQSLLRYAKRARMQQRIASLGQNLIDFGHAVDSEMNDLILQTTSSGVFPLQVPLAVAPTPPAVRPPPPRVTARWAFA